MKFMDLIQSILMFHVALNTVNRKKRKEGMKEGRKGRRKEGRKRERERGRGSAKTEQRKPGNTEGLNKIQNFIT